MASASSTSTRIRLLDAVSSQLLVMNAADLKRSIQQSEGRTIAAEVICTYQSPVDGVSHGEIAAAMGVDIVVLDRYDSLKPEINGTPAGLVTGETPLIAYQKLIGLPVGINMIVADEVHSIALGGRAVNEHNVARIVEQGCKLIFLSMRPKMGATETMMQTLASEIKARYGDQLMLIGVPAFSKPAPRTENLLESYQEEIVRLLEVGCEGIGLPMPGTKQGWTVEQAGTLIDYTHARDGLAWLLLTASIEGASQELISQLALMGKQIGADAFRIDESGLSGMPPPENILAFSLALRGKRHTFRRMATSILR